MDEAVKTCFIKFWKKQYLMQCLYIFIPFYFYFFYFCMEVAHKLTIISIISSAAMSFGSKTFSFYLVYLLPAHLTLNVQSDLFWPGRILKTIKSFCYSS